MKKIIDIPTIIKSALEGEDILAAIQRKACKQQRKNSFNLIDFEQ
jgi:hypothetical protein